MQRLDVEKLIEEQKHGIEYRIKNSGLTKEQLKKGFKLVSLADKVQEVCDGFMPNGYERNHLSDEASDILNKCEAKAEHAILEVFHEILDMLDFDGREVIEIQRDKDELEIFEEIAEFGGYVVEVDHEVDRSYHAISKRGDYYTWSVMDRGIQCKELNEVPDYIKEFLSE